MHGLTPGKVLTDGEEVKINLTKIVWLDFL
jgi:hypothetical protein